MKNKWMIVRSLVMGIVALGMMAKTTLAAPAYVQSLISSTSTNVASRTATFTNAVANGDFVLVAISTYRSAGSPNIASVTDNKGNAYTKISQLPSTQSGTDQLSLWYAKNVVGGSSFAITATGASSGYISMAIHEYSGVDSNSPIDQSTNNSGTGTAANSGTTNLTAGGAEMVFGAFLHSASTSVNFTAGSGFNLRQRKTSRIGLATEDKNVTSTGSGYSANGTWASSVGWKGIVTVVKGSTVIPTNTPTPTPTTIMPTNTPTSIISSEIGKQLKHFSTIANRDYLLFLPNNYSSAPQGGWPMIVFFHGYGIVVGTSNADGIRMEPLPGMLDSRPSFPFVVLSPRMYESDLTGASSGWLTTTARDQMFQLIEEIQSNYNINRNKTNLTGYSMGGGVTWNMAVTRPEKFASIVPVAGFYESYTSLVIPTNICSLWTKPMRVYYGGADQTIPPYIPQGLVNALMNCGDPDTVTTITNSSWTHDSIREPVFSTSDDLYNWMALQSLAVTPTETPTPTPIPTITIPTETPTPTPTTVPPTNTPTMTPTAIPPTNTPTLTPTLVPPTNTPTLTPTAVPPTSTLTLTPTTVPPTNTPTLTPTAVPPTNSPTPTPTTSSSIGYVQGAVAYSTGYVASLATSLPSTVANGSLVVVSISDYSFAPANITSVTDNKGNTYTRAIASPAVPSGNNQISIWYSANVIGGSGFKVTAASANNNAYITQAVQVYTGMASTNVFDVATSAGGTGTAATTGLTSQTSQNNELVIGAFMHQSANSLTATPASGFSIRQSMLNGSYQPLLSEEKIVSATGQYSAGLTWSASATWLGAVATFRGQ